MVVSPSWEVPVVTSSSYQLETKRGDAGGVGLSGFNERYYVKR